MESTWTTIARNALKYKELRKHYQKLETEALEALKKLSNYKNHEENGLRLTINKRLGVISYKDIPELKWVNLEEYRTMPVLTCTLEVYERNTDKTLTTAQEIL